MQSVSSFTKITQQAVSSQCDFGCMILGLLLDDHDRFSNTVQ